MLEYRVLMADLPTTVRGYVIQTFDGFSTIVLNARLNIWQNRKSFKHEIDHIIHDDFYAEESAAVIESIRHK